MQSDVTCINDQINRKDKLYKSLSPKLFRYLLHRLKQSKRTIKYPIIYLYWRICCCLRILRFLKLRVWAAGGPLKGDICIIRQCDHHKRPKPHQVPTWLQGRCDTPGYGSHQTSGWLEMLQRWGSSCGHRDSLRWPRDLQSSSPASSMSPDTLHPPSAPQSQGSRPDCLDCHPRSHSCSLGDQMEPFCLCQGLMLVLVRQENVWHYLEVSWN